MAVWIIRGGGNGEFEEEALDKSLAIPGFGLRVDLSDMRAEDDIKRLLEQEIQDVSERAIRTWAGQIWAFKDRIKHGDLIIMPRKMGRTVAIGEMAGEYAYRPEAAEGARHVRQVRWVNSDVPRDSLDPDLQKSMNVPRTVYQPTGKDAERRLRRQGVAPDLWDEYVKRAKEYVDTGRLESEEIEYKVGIGGELSKAREAVLAGADDWGSLVKSGIVSHQNNLIYIVQLARFRDWINRSPDEAWRALNALWTHDDMSVASRISGFAEILPSSAAGGVGTRMNVISVLLMAMDVEQYPPFRIRLFNRAYERTGYDKPEQNADEAALYGHALGFLDRFIQEASQRGLTLRHRLDAQSVVWALQDDGWDTDITEVDDGGDQPTPEPSGPDLQALADDLHLPVDFLQEIHTLLEDKKQVIFQGPPGTGKTYVAQALAKHLAGSQERVTLVQFHPSYAYEDFVQGFRPALRDGQPGFELRAGPLLRAAEQARKEPGSKHLLVIDEINRGTIAKVFGELYFLLEYRDSEMQLQYSDEPFSLPGNLYIIGTMNTADRSIALVDLALRRRFYFVEFHPDQKPVKCVLGCWLEANGLDHVAWVADVVKLANEKLQVKQDRHAAIGPSYFMKPGLDEAAVERIWKHSVLPYIEERLFVEGEGLGEFRLDALRRSAASGSEGDQNGSSAADGDGDVGTEGDPAPVNDA